LTALSNAGTSIILVTHDLRGVLDAVDRVIGMRSGGVVFDTPPDVARAELAALDVHVPPRDDSAGESQRHGSGRSN